MSYTVTTALMALFTFAKTLASDHRYKNIVRIQLKRRLNCTPIHVLHTVFRLAEQVHGMLASESADSNLQLLMDFAEPGQTALLEMLVHSASPITVHEVTALRRHQERHRLPLRCPDFQSRPNMTDAGPVFEVNQDEIYQRKQLVTADSRSPMTFVTWVSSRNIGVAVNLFESEIMWCKQKVDMGLLDKNNKLLFVVQGRDDTVKIFSSSQLANHPKVASVIQTNNHLEIWISDFYAMTDHDGIMLSKAVSLNTVLKENLNNMYNNQRTFNGKLFKILNIPLAYYAIATFAEDAESPIKLFKNRWGLSMDLMAALQEKLDFRVEFFNPDPVWDLGRVAKDGAWTGGTSMIHDRTCDLILDWSMDFGRSQVMELVPYNYLDYESFASPGPHPKSKIFAITSPFGAFVWLCVLLSVPAMGAVSYILANQEGRLLNKVIKPWMFLGEAVWYAFGTLQGESITRDINITSIYALR